ncbi:MAG: GIY-YIG nuclease family protein [Lactobacillaceae bacterium]|jgi:hypothetical protein|nr:GIY-YIG nuclease family protein [Lactobacillaceae bacterium]
MIRRINNNDGSDKIIVKTHVGIFTFNKIGEILSKEDYNQLVDVEKKKDVVSPDWRYCRHIKSTYGWVIDKKPESVIGCYMLFTDKGLEMLTPNYIGKTIDINSRFRTHCCSSDFENCVCKDKKERLYIFFCEKTPNCKEGAIEALMIGYNWHSDLWNRF